MYCKALCNITFNACGNSTTRGSEYCRVHRNYFKSKIPMPPMPPTPKCSIDTCLNSAQINNTMCCRHIELTLIHCKINQYMEHLSHIQVQLNEQLLFIQSILNL